MYICILLPFPSNVVFVVDDETDNLFVVSGQGAGKWVPITDIQIMQVKLDLLQFDLDKPLDK